MNNDAAAATTTASIRATLLETGADGLARFRDVLIPLPHGTPASRLTALAPCGGWQLRRSPPGFASGWHCTGEPQWLLVLQGRMEIGLRDGSARTFGAGEFFYSGDLLPAGCAFDDAIHGHRSRAVGDAPLITMFVRAAHWQPESA